MLFVPMDSLGKINVFKQQSSFQKLVIVLGMTMKWARFVFNGFLVDVGLILLLFLKNKDLIFKKEELISFDPYILSCRK